MRNGGAKKKRRGGSATCRTAAAAAVENRCLTRSFVRASPARLFLFDFDPISMHERQETSLMILTLLGSGRREVGELVGERPFSSSSSPASH